MTGDLVIGSLANLLVHHTMTIPQPHSMAKFMDAPNATQISSPNHSEALTNMALICQ